MLVCVLCAAPASGTDDLESLTVSYNLSPCAAHAKETDLRAPITAAVVGISLKHSYENDVPVGSKPGPYVATFRVVPDAYYIQGMQARTGCSPTAGVVRIVLPGHPVSASVSLASCCGDVFAYSYVAGLIDDGLDVDLLNYPTAACNTPIDDSSLVPLRVQDNVNRDGNAYYGYVNDVEDGTLILKVSGNGKTGFVKADLQPNGRISTQSTYKRLDATRQLLDAAAANGHRLFCMDHTISKTSLFAVSTVSVSPASKSCESCSASMFCESCSTGDENHGRIP